MSNFLMKILFDIIIFYEANKNFFFILASSYLYILNKGMNEFIKLFKLCLTRLGNIKSNKLLYFRVSFQLLQAIKELNQSSSNISSFY